MRSRFTALTLGLYLSFALLGCNKPAAPADSSAPSSAAPASSDNSNSSAPSGNMANSSSDNKSDSAMSNSAMSSMKHEAPKPLVVPAGTVITVRLGQAVGSKISYGRSDFHSHRGQSGCGRGQDGNRLGR